MLLIDPPPVGSPPEEWEKFFEEMGQLDQSDPTVRLTIAMAMEEADRNRQTTLLLEEAQAARRLLAAKPETDSLSP